MSSSKAETAKPKRSIGAGIFAIVKRKKKSKRSISTQDLCSRSNSAYEATNLSGTEILTETVEFRPDFMDMDEEGQLVEDLKAQLLVSQSDLDAAGSKIKEDEEAIAALQIQLQNVKEELENTQTKMAQMEEGSEGVLLDDNSFHEAEVFKLKKQIEDLQQELGKKNDLDKQVSRLTDEVAYLQTQNQELRFQEERSSTRSKMKSINEEKNTKEEVQRLQKELRMAERNMKFEVSNFEAQLKVAQDGNDRLQEKAKVAQTRFDEVDKERLELKIENNRLQKKLDKAGSFAEKKRLQTEQETVELEMKNLKRKNVKLEKQLITTSNQMLNMVGFGGSDRREDGASLSGMTSPVPRLSLSESKMINLEKEVAQLEAAVTKLKKENESLEDKAGSFGQTSEVFSLKVKQLDDQLTAERSKVKEMETELGRLKKVAAGTSGEDYLAGLHKQIDDLEKNSKHIETKFRVKEKDLWSTIEAQKRKIEDLEMEKLALELGEEEEEEGEGSDIDERDSTPKPESQSLNRISELKQEIDSLKSSNEKLKEDLQAALIQLEEATERENRWLSEQQQKETDTENKQTEEREKLKTNNEHLQAALEESVTKSEKLQSDFVSFQDESMALKKHNEELTKDLEETRSTSKQVPALQIEIDGLKQEVESLVVAAKSNEAASDVITSLEKEVDRLNMLSSKLMKDLEAAEEEIDHREDNIEETKKLQAQIEKLQKENKKCQTDLDNAEDELEKLDAELIEQMRVLNEEIKNLKKENAEVRAAAAGKRESTPRPRQVKESSPPKKDVKVKEPPAPAPKKGPKTVLKKAKSPPAKKDSSQFSVPAVAIKTKRVVITGGVKLPTPPPKVEATKEPEDNAVTQQPEAKPEVEAEGKKEVEVETSKVEADTPAAPAAEDQSQEVVSEVTEMKETETVPSLTPKFKKPPPAPKKKPSRGSLHKKAEESQNID